ncbi:MAG: response regulator [Myxococcaceae bacterium]|nr:response regulator [Myxococcaceae bacterium]
MREISGRVTKYFVEHGERHGLSRDSFVEGTGVTVEHLTNDDGRIDWDIFVEVTRRLGRICDTSEKWAELGKKFGATPTAGTMAAVLRIIATPRGAARWIARFGGVRLFGNMRTTVRDVEKTLHVTITIAPGYQSCPEFFYMCRGGFMAIPTVMGAPEIPVDLVIDGNVGRYVLDFTALERPGWRREVIANWWASAKTRLGSRGKVLENYERQELLLEARYVELEKAKKRIEAQQEMLQLVHEITAATHENLRLSQALEVIGYQIHTRLQFDAVEVHVKARQDGVMVDQRVHAGAAFRDGIRHQQKLVFRDVELGVIEVCRTKQEISAADKELLALVVESVALSVQNAVAYEVIASYRNDLEQKVATRTSELAEAREQLERSLESRNQFFSNVNHDLRSPLMAMLLVIQRIAQNPNLNADAKRSLEQAQANAQRMKDLVEDLLSLASGSEGKRVEMVQVDAATMLEHIGNALRPVAESKNLELKIEVEPGLVFDANAKQIERAYSNLADNALKYTDAGSVTLRASAHDDGVVLAVTDTGPGIPKDYVEKVFNRFVQVPRAKASPGAGIGLALVREIAIQNGGNVGLESEVGRGSTFFIRLPKKSGGLRKRVEPKVQTLQFDASKPSTKAERLFPTSVKLLICEDDPGLAQQLSDFFTENGLEVTRAANGEEALEIAAKKPPALLLTDIDLGTGIDGLELCRRFRALPNHHNAAAIVLTADTRRQLVTALDAGAVDFLRKPVNLNELAARVRAQLAYRRLAMRLLESEKMAAHASALTGLAHELRNPLNGLINAVAPLKELISVGDDTRTANDLLDVIEECGRRVASLAHQLLNYSPDQAVPNERVPVVEIVSQAVKVIRPKVNDRRLTTTIRYQGSILGSSEQLSQIVINLLDNAAYAAGPGGLISVATELEGDNVVVEVSDSGPGIEPELQERVFEPFFTTKAAGEGVGLGLAISRDIARRHSGDLVIRPGRPFAMRLTLPRVADEIAGA